MWTIPALLFLVGFFHRAAPGVMARDLMPAFDVTSAGVGALTATYVYSYAALMVQAYRTGFALCAALGAGATLLGLLMHETRGHNIHAELRGRGPGARIGTEPA